MHMMVTKRKTGRMNYDGRWVWNLKCKLRSGKHSSFYNEGLSSAIWTTVKLLRMLQLGVLAARALEFSK